ncbi:MAG: MFS transporter [Pseudomonadota bacterium]
MKNEIPVYTKGHPPAFLSWSVWGLAACFYLIGFYQRVAPAVMTVELMTDFGLGAAGLGNLSAFYFYAYVAMQIPTGLLADAYGPRLVLTLGAAAAACGIIMFALADTWAMAGAGRLLIGGAVAVGYVVMLKLAGHWLPHRQYAFSSGLALACGVLGAVTAGVPLRLLVDYFGWRPVMLVSGGLTLVVGTAIFIFVRNDPSEKGYLGYAPPPGLGPGKKGGPSALAGLIQAFKYRNIRLLFLAPGGIVGPVLAFAGLWGVPFLQARYGLSQTQGAAVCSTLMTCWALSGPIMGGLSDRIGRRKPLYLIGAIISTAAWALMIFTPGLPLTAFIVLIVITGFASGVMIIGFAFGKESTPAGISGAVAGVINMGVMSGPTILQPAIGWVLDRFWTGETAGGLRLYSQGSYQAGFALMIAWGALACLFIALTKETHCRESP